MSKSTLPREPSASSEIREHGSTVRMSSNAALLVRSFGGGSVSPATGMPPTREVHPATRRTASNTRTRGNTATHAPISPQEFGEIQARSGFRQCGNQQLRDRGRGRAAVVALWGRGVVEVDLDDLVRA